MTAQPSAISQQRRADAAAMRLVAIARAGHTFMLSDAGEVFAVPRDGPPVVRLLRGGRHSLRAELSHLYAVEHRAVPTHAALADALLARWMLNRSSTLVGVTPLRARCQFALSRGISALLPLKFGVREGFQHLVVRPISQTSALVAV
jgi:hypothetical protein